MEIVCYRANAAEVFKAEQAGMGKTGFQARLEGLDVGEIVNRGGVEAPRREYLRFFFP